MRLIDADKLKIDMDCNIDFGGIDNRLVVLEQIDNAPTVEERKQGKWIDTGYHQYYNDGEIETTELKCPCCNEVVEWDILLSHKPYYCENCGAEMRGSDNG